MRRIAVYSFFAFFWASSVAQESPALITLRAKYETAKTRLEKPFVDLQNFYTNALLKFKDDARKRGELEQVLAIDNELNRLKGGHSIPEIPSRFVDLAKARKKFKSAHGQISTNIEEPRSKLSLAYF